MKIGYARTSTLDQKAGFEAQLDRLQKEGCSKIFCEQVSALAGRPELARAIDYIRQDDGDVLTVTKLDRLARSVADLLAIIDRLKAKGAVLKVLDSPIDMTTPYGELILNILGAIAQFERELMLVRQREGIAKAKADGKYAGRQPTARAKSAEVLALATQGVEKSEIARRLNIGRASVYRILSGSRARIQSP